MTTYRAAAASTDRFTLAEGPVWHPERRELLWVDIEAGAVLTGTLDRGRIAVTSSTAVDRQVGAAVPSPDGRVLVAGTTDVVVLEPDGTRTPGPRVVPGLHGQRLNDGGCDPAGRFVVGSLAFPASRHDVLAVLDDDGVLRTLDSDLALSNGLAWSADGTTMFSIDTDPGIVYRRGYDPATGTAGERSVAFVPAGPGSADGMCVDVEGNLWIAFFGAAEVRCYTPGGDVLHTVAVAAPNVTSVAFAGAGLDTLVITTATVGMSEDALAAWPDAGRLFVADVGVAGLPVPLWNGRAIPPPAR